MISIILSNTFPKNFDQSEMRRTFAVISLLFFLGSCSEDPWTEEEKIHFIKDCMAEADDSNYCNCFMNRVMERYPQSEDAEKISFEETVEIATDCKE